MESTINNMNLILKKAKVRFREDDYQNVRTLMDAYIILLRQMTKKAGITIEKLTYEEDLRSQITILTEMENKTNDKIQIELRNDNYTAVGDIVTIVDIIQKSKLDLMQTLAAIHRFKRDNLAS